MNYEGQVSFYRSGTLLGKGDQSLVSTTVLSEVEKWEKSGVKFTEIKVPAFHIYSVMCGGRFDVISIDVEGIDIEILTQINLAESATTMVCIETNSIPEREEIAKKYCASFGLTVVKKFGAENLIITKP
jgi:DNA-binding XRE family transcriptional regulator